MKSSFLFQNFHKLRYDGDADKFIETSFVQKFNHN